MKRALAERARQAEALEKQQHEVALSNAKEQPNRCLSLGSHAVPSAVNGGSQISPTSPSIPVDTPKESSSSSGEVGVGKNVQTPEELQRPKKMPRLQMPPSNSIIPSSTQESNSITTPPPLSTSASTSSHRRLSMEPAMNENTESSFYLKYQNRALATELKSYQYAVAELEQERDLRRAHCFSIVQALSQIHTLWNAMEQDIVSQKEPSSRGENHATVAGAPSTSISALNSGSDADLDRMSSTGTEDSVEWTRALYNALIALGQSDLLSIESTRSAEENGLPTNPLVAPSNPDVNVSSEYLTDLSDLDQTVRNISVRARILQEWVHKMVCELPIGHSSSSSAVASSEAENSASALHTPMQQQISEITARCATLEGQIAELVSCRTELIHRERRLRRNIYRMAANIITPEQVVNAITRDESDDTDEIEASVQIEKQQFMMKKKGNQPIDASSTVASGPVHGNDGDGASNFSNNAHVSSIHLEEFQSRIASLEDMLTNAEQSIQSLNSALKEKETEITALSQKQLSEDVAVKLEMLQSTLSQLKTSQTQNAELQNKLETTERRWSQSLGNEGAVVAALSELVSKFNKRWLELTHMGSPELPVDTTSETKECDPADGKMEDVATPPFAASMIPFDQGVFDHPRLVLSQQITELQHKLNQAMENVRQAELSRDNLKMALIMNASLQAKLDEVKAKYAALQASRGGSTSKTPISVSDSTEIGNGSSQPPRANSSGSPVDDAVTSVVSDSTRTADTAAESDALPVPKNAKSSSKEKLKCVSTNKDRSVSGSKSNESKSSSSHAKPGSSSTEKLHREYRRARKELTSLTASHSTLMSNNVRLLKQISEKDEMNAKSLSTILHLKSMTEKLIEERDTLELQLKSASQLALVARLATNAKERVSEELQKEKKEVDERLVELEKQLHSTQTELHRVSTECSTASSRMSTKDAELSNTLQRSRALVEENEQKREEIRKLMDIVSKTEREAREAKEKLIHFTKSSNEAVGDSGSDSSFTMDQLKTQVSVLKNRLACPVCHYRDKECIILRCRHMHCKQCVEERVSNRSRKCPTCNVKFAENEVETIFLS